VWQVARYYYKVYTAKRGYKLRYLGNTTVAAGDSIAGWETHSLNYNTGEHWCTDWKEIWYYENDVTTYVCKVLTDGVTVHKTRWMEPANRLATTRRYETYLTDYEKDRLVETIIAEDGTYPDDGYNSTTGYWYVKTTLAETVTVTAPTEGTVIQGEYEITFTPSSNLLPTEISLSTDNGVRWKVIATVEAGVASYTHDFFDENESAQCKIRARAKDGANYGDYSHSDGVFTILHNVAPTAPIELHPASLVIDRTNVQRFSWKHNDTDTQSKFELQWSSDGGTTWNTVTQDTPNQYVDISANVFPAGQITWKVRTYDTYDEVSPWPEQVVFTAGEPSVAPIVTEPASPVAISRPLIKWSQPDQTHYQVQIYDAVQQLAWDSGEVSSTNRQVVCGTDLLNGGVYKIQVRAKSKDGIWSGWGSKTIEISYTPPAKPSVELAADNSRCSILFAINHPAPTGAQPAVKYVDILRSELHANNFVRIATSDIETPGIYYLSKYYVYIEPKFTDYTVQPGQIYEYRVRAVGENGTSTLSDVVQAMATIGQSQLSLLSSPIQFIDLDVMPSRSLTYEMHGKQMHFAGRRKPVTQFEEFEDAELHLSGTLYRAGDMRKLESIVKAKKAILYRDCRGRKAIGTITNLMATDDMIDDDWYHVSFTLTEVDYDEAI
jgi:hypothetical protein